MVKRFGGRPKTSLRRLSRRKAKTVTRTIPNVTHPVSVVPKVVKKTDKAVVPKVGTTGDDITKKAIDNLSPERKTQQPEMEPLLTPGNPNNPLQEFFTDTMWIAEHSRDQTLVKPSFDAGGGIITNFLLWKLLEHFTREKTDLTKRTKVLK